MSTLPFYEPVAGDFAAVNQLILDQLHSRVPLVEKIGHYIISAGGKRLRPLVVLLSARACDAHGPDQHKLATIIEFLHTATLLHGKHLGSGAVDQWRSVCPSWMQSLVETQLRDEISLYESLARRFEAAATGGGSRAA